MYWICGNARKIIRFAVILCVVPVQAMDYVAYSLLSSDLMTMPEPMEVEEEEFSMCYLKLLPIDLQDMIVKLCRQDDALDYGAEYESEKELLARIKSKKAIQKPELIDNGVRFVHNLCDTGRVVFYFPKQGFFCKSKPVLQIFKKQRLSRYVTLSGCKKENFKYVALSSRVQRLAFIAKRYVREKTKNILVLRDLVRGDKPIFWDIMIIPAIICKKSKEINIGDLKEPFFIDFNKQGTHIAVQGVDSTTQATICKMFPLNIHTNIEEKLTPLQEYFREKRVCKQIGYAQQL